MTEAAPCRFDVPTQSAPVSPPPITMTCFPSAEMVGSIAERFAADSAVLLREERHREVDAVEFPAGDGEVTRLLTSGGQHDRFVFVEEALDRPVHTDVTVDAELDALGLHLRHPSVDGVLVELEVRDAVAEQAADLGVLLEHLHAVPGPGELLCGGQARRSRSDNGDPLVGAAARDLRFDPALPPRLLDDRVLDRLDRHRGIVEVERARFLTRSGTDPSGELGEVVGRVQDVDRLTPSAAVDEVVPVGDEVVDGAPGMAVGDAAVDAPGTLLGHFCIREGDRELEEVPASFLDRDGAGLTPVDLLESGW